MATDLASALACAPQLSKDFYLARQPILDRRQRLVAYELLFRSADVATAGVCEDLYATASVIAHLSELGLEQVVGDRRAFVNIDAAALFNDILKFLPNDKVVLEILETVQASPDVLSRVAEMRQLGFRFALDDVVRDTDLVRRLLPQAEVVKIDILGMPRDVLARLARAMRAAGKQLLAEKVETVAEFEHCLALGFDLFQGYYFAKPVVLSGKKLAPSELALTRVLDLIEQDADNALIEQAIKQHATIGINLLRLVNTPAAGCKRRIDSLSQALLVLGQQQLKRWVQILLFARTGQGQRLDAPLLLLAVTRARLLELIAEQAMPGQRRLAQAAFTVGIMSLMDALFSMAMDELLAKINVSEDIRAALLQRQGVYGELLNLAERIERGMPLAAADLRRHGLSGEVLQQLQQRAFEWTDKVVRAG